MIHFLSEKASAEQVDSMLEALDVYIKLAVDVELEVVAGGGALHSDCESVLLDHGSDQRHIWGADWIPHDKRVTFESLINIRPNENNFSLEIQNRELRAKVEKVVRKIFDDDKNKES